MNGLHAAPRADDALESLLRTNPNFLIHQHNECKLDKKERLKNDLKRHHAIVVEARRTKGGEFAKWNMKVLKALLQYKKQQGDPTLPTKVADARERCAIVASRSSPPCSPLRERDGETPLPSSDGGGVDEQMVHESEE